MKRLTIFSPTYNRAYILPKLYESLCQQTCQDFEWLVVDDGSTDDSGAICDMYADSNQRIRVIHKSNEGVSKARKTGCKEAKGDYVMFIDSDDLINEICIEKMAKILSNVEVDIIKFGILWERKDGSVEKSHLNHVGKYESLKDLFNKEIKFVIAYIIITADKISNQNFISFQKLFSDNNSGRVFNINNFWQIIKPELATEIISLSFKIKDFTTTNEYLEMKTSDRIIIDSYCREFNL